MAGKKVPSMEDQINIFKDVIFRASGKPISEVQFHFMNNVLICDIEIKNKKYSLIFSIESYLWDKITQDDEIHMSELNIEDSNNKDIIKKIAIILNLNPECWISVDAMDLYSGNVIKFYQYQLGKPVVIFTDTENM